MNKNGFVTREELENLEFLKPLTKISNIVSSLAVVYSALEKFSSVGKKKKQYYIAFHYCPLAVLLKVPGQA